MEIRYFSTLTIWRNEIRFTVLNLNDFFIIVTLSKLVCIKVAGLNVGRLQLLSTNVNKLLQSEV